MEINKNRKNKIDDIYNEIVSRLVKNGTYFKLPMERHHKFKYESYISGINEYSYANDRTVRNITYYFHYFSYEFDDILEEYKKENNITCELNNYTVRELFYKYKDTLNDLSWLITNVDYD
jgi:hypothetical protein